MADVEYNDFGFTAMDADELASVDTKIVETIPGWSHTITNTGEQELITMIWANEIYDSNNPDTFSIKYESFRMLKCSLTS